MTTAEIMFAQPGDRTIDHQHNARKILWALLAAIVIHLLFAYLLAMLGGVVTPALPSEEKPVELTFVDTSPVPLVPKNSAFIETDESKKSVEPPDEKTFESNANSIAASELPATGEAPLPSQMGKDRPLVDLETHAYSLQMNGAQPQPSAAPQESPNPSPPPQSTTQPPPLTAAEQFAMLAAKPGPEIDRSDAPASAQPRSAYRAYKERTQISGRITNRGVSSVNALGTPLGRYRKILLDAIGSRWYAFLDQKRDLINIGTTRVVFVIDRDGRVNNLKVIENTANEASANVCIQSIQDAQLPPIPDDVAGTLPAEGLDMDIPFTIFAN
jgi:outer membrane biosynthesis protein TonB